MKLLQIFIFIVLLFQPHLESGSTFQFLPLFLRHFIDYFGKRQFIENSRKFDKNKPFLTDNKID